MAHHCCTHIYTILLLFCQQTGSSGKSAGYWDKLKQDVVQDVMYYSVLYMWCQNSGQLCTSKYNIQCKWDYIIHKCLKQVTSKPHTKQEKKTRCAVLHNYLGVALLLQGWYVKLTNNVFNNVLNIKKWCLLNDQCYDQIIKALMPHRNLVLSKVDACLINVKHPYHALHVSFNT